MIRCSNVVSTFIRLTAISVIVLSPAAVVHAEKKPDKSGVVAPAPAESPSARAMPRPAECGGMEFDRNAGRMVPRPNVDLVVSHLEVINTERGTWVRPTIRDRCPGPIYPRYDEIHVLIGGSVVVTFGPIPPETDVPLGTPVGVSPTPPYTAVVDYDDRITEADERNNRCTRNDTGRCP